MREAFERSYSSLPPRGGPSVPGHSVRRCERSVGRAIQTGMVKPAASIVRNARRSRGSMIGVLRRTVGLHVPFIWSSAVTKVTATQFPCHVADDGRQYL